MKMYLQISVFKYEVPKTLSILCSFKFLDVGLIIHDSTGWVLATLFVSDFSDKFLDAGFMIPLVWI